jgi:hypothetical protein
MSTSIQYHSVTPPAFERFVGKYKDVWLPDGRGWTTLPESVGIQTRAGMIVARYVYDATNGTLTLEFQNKPDTISLGEIDTGVRAMLEWAVGSTSEPPVSSLPR